MTPFTGPVLIHVLTTKGKGYEPAEENPGDFHGIGPFDIATGKPAPGNSRAQLHRSFRRHHLCTWRETKPSIAAISAAMVARHRPEPICRDLSGPLFRCRHRRTACRHLCRRTGRRRHAPGGGHLFHLSASGPMDQIIHDVCLPEPAGHLCHRPGRRRRRRRPHPPRRF